ncbi:hypothetical protein FM020_00850 [Acinetobacter tandoii]|nr:hypothetical protein FM020_00850 [Acinetobacter tandoii]
MKIAAIRIGLCCLFFLHNSYAVDQWSQRWEPSRTRSAEHLAQANLIELKEADYYDSVGKTTIYSNSTSTSSIGTVNSSTSNVNLTGSDNNVGISADAQNESEVNSTTNKANQACPNLGTLTGATLC